MGQTVNFQKKHTRIARAMTMNASRTLIRWAAIAAMLTMKASVASSATIITGDASDARRFSE